MQSQHRQLFHASPCISVKWSLLLTKTHWMGLPDPIWVATHRLRNTEIRWYNADRVDLRFPNQWNLNADPSRKWSCKGLGKTGWESNCQHVTVTIISHRSSETLASLQLLPPPPPPCSTWMEQLTASSARNLPISRDVPATSSYVPNVTKNWGWRWKAGFFLGLQIL
jgi:hypothetical protein